MYPSRLPPRPLDPRQSPGGCTDDQDLRPRERRADAEKPTTRRERQAHARAAQGGQDGDAGHVLLASAPHPLDSRTFSNDSPGVGSADMMNRDSGTGVT